MVAMHCVVADWETLGRKNTVTLKFDSMEAACTLTHEASHHISVPVRKLVTKKAIVARLGNKDAFPVLRLKS